MVPHFTTRRSSPMDIIRICVELSLAQSGDVVGNTLDQFIKKAYAVPLYVTQVFGRIVNLGIWKVCFGRCTQPSE